MMQHCAWRTQLRHAYHADSACKGAVIPHQRELLRMKRAALRPGWYRHGLAPETLLMASFRHM